MKVVPTQLAETMGDVCYLVGRKAGRIEKRQRVKEKNRTERKGKEKGEVAVAGLRYWPLSWKG